MSWEVDHVVAKANGGTDDMTNLVPACWTCNLAKRAKGAKRFARDVARDGPPGWKRR